MSEHHIPKAESQESSSFNQEIQKRQHEALKGAQEAAERSKHEQAKDIERLRDLVQEQAVDTATQKKHEQTSHQEPEEANTYWYSREYRELAFKQLMNRVRKSMSKPDQAASKFIHRPAVERVSEIGEKTVARTSGVLVGSIFSFIASIGTYYFSRQNGYDMTYSVFFVSFIGGFFIGIIAEFIYRSLRTLLSRS